MAVKALHISWYLWCGIMALARFAVDLYVRLGGWLTGLGSEQARHGPASLARAVHDHARVRAHVDVARVDRVNAKVVSFGKHPLLVAENKNTMNVARRTLENGS